MLALFVADIGHASAAFDTFHLYIRHTPAVWRANTGSFVDLLNSSGPLLACIMSTLWFALFFAVVRYGRRDAFVRLTALFTAGAFLAFLAMPWISLSPPPWRRWPSPPRAFPLQLPPLGANHSKCWPGRGAAAPSLALAALCTVLSRQFLAQHPAIARGLGGHPLALDALVFSFQGSLLPGCHCLLRALHGLLLPDLRPQPDSTLAH